MKRLALLAALFLAICATPASAQQDLKPGTVFKDCDECPELVVVPKGLFILGMGSTTARAKPPTRIAIKKSFAIGRYEVTWDQWEACRADGGCAFDPSDHGWGKGKRPVVNADLPRVENYLKWLKTKTGQTYRLPSEAEWEYAHRGGTTTNFWWGDEAGEGNANCKDCKTQWSAKSTAPVGSFEANPFGLFDTAGNAYEWTADCWNQNHENRARDQSARDTGDCKRRVIRGGSFYYFNKVARSFYRSKNPTAVKSYWLSFRVVRDIN